MGGPVARMDWWWIIGARRRRREVKSVGSASESIALCIVRIGTSNRVGTEKGRP